MVPLLLSVHVIAGLLFVGPVAVVVSLFPRYAPTEGASPSSRRPDGERSLAVAKVLHRITRLYGTIAVIVPVVGIALAVTQGRMGEIWITIAMILTAAAGALLLLQIAPRQSLALNNPDDGTQLRRIGMLAGIFNLLWVAVVVMMVVRPGSHYV